MRRTAPFGIKNKEVLAAKLREQGKSDEEIERLELKDEVLIRTNGNPTYFAADIAYHRNKLQIRGFDKAIDVLGARIITATSPG